MQNMTATSTKEVYFILYFEFEYRKSHTIKGDTMLKLISLFACWFQPGLISPETNQRISSICATKCSNIYIHPQIHRQDSLHFTLTLTVLRGAALPHLSDRWGLGGIYTLLLPPQRFSASSSSLQLI